MLHESDVSCIFHQDRFADGRCVICGKPLCSSCRAPIDERWVCSADAEVLREWVEVFQTVDPFAADAVVRNLTLNGYELRTYDDAQYRDDPQRTDGARVRVFVRSDRHSDAVKFLRELDLDRIDVVLARNHQ